MLLRAKVGYTHLTVRIKVKSNDALIMDVCMLGQSEVLVLFDCGATNSFIVVDCVQRLNLPSVPLIPPMTVAVATGGKVTSKRVCQNCPVLVGSKVYHIDLICLPLKDINMFLGMDWLSAILCTLDVLKRICLFQPKPLQKVEPSLL